ncbi:MAG: DUF4249 domain-containing protein [Paludibacter sp.]|jgi:hypothetical protein|nr:DUF4249 domain-containing protein [Paludibacter sp.]
MKKLFNILLLLPVLTLFQCENPIDFDLDLVESKLVLQSLLTSTENVSVQLSASRFFLDESDKFRKINNATILLFKDDVIIDTLHRSAEDEGGYYFSDYIPQAGDHLKLQAAAPGFESVESEITVVALPNLVSAEVLDIKCRAQTVEWLISHQPYRTYIDTVIYYLTANITLTIADTPEIDEYYNIILYLKTNYIDGTSELTRFPFESKNIVFSSNEVNVDMFGGGEMAKNYNIFSDELFAGRNYSITVNLPENFYSYFWPESITKSQYLIVELHSVSKDYYFYRLTAAKAYNGMDMGGMFGEPVQVYSNVKNGIGVVGSYNVVRKEIKLNKSDADITEITEIY